MVEMTAGAGPVPVRVPDGRIWTFERLDDASVRIQTDPDDPTPAVIVPATMWASIVASVSWAGETENRYRKAYRFHHGDDPDGEV